MSRGGSALFINSWGEGSAPFNKCEILKTQTNTLFPAWPWVLDILRRNSSIKRLYQSTQQSSGKNRQINGLVLKFFCKVRFGKVRNCRRWFLQPPVGICSALLVIQAECGSQQLQTWCNELWPSVSKALSSHSSFQGGSRGFTFWVQVHQKILNN